MYCRGDGEEEVVVAKARRNQYKELVKGKLYTPRKQKSPPSKALVCDEACFSAAHTRHTSPAKLNQIMRRFGFPKRERHTRVLNSLVVMMKPCQISGTTCSGKQNTTW